MQHLTMKDRLLIIGNLLIAILLIFTSTYLVALMNSHIFAVILAVIVAGWIYLVFGKRLQRGEIQSAKHK